MVSAVPPRLRVGIIGSGRVGAVLGAALRRVGHPIVAVSARTDLSRVRAEALLPGVPIAPPAEVAADCDLLLLTVTDDALSDAVAELAPSRHRGQFIAHTSGRHGLSILAPAIDTGALAMALHPAMTFTGTSLDLARLEDCPFAVTANPPEQPVADALVIEMGGIPVEVSEQARLLYHAALAHGANHLVTLVAQTRELLNVPGVSDPSALVAPLLRAALDNALREGDDALTGPVSRGDAGTLIDHVRDLQEVSPETADTYRALATATARRAHAAGRLDDEQVRRILDALEHDDNSAAEDMP